VLVGSAPTSNPQGPHRPRVDDARGARSGSGIAGQSAHSVPADDSASVSSGTSDVALLLDRLRAMPEIRADRVRQVGERLEQGAYRTREAADQTAAALLGSGRG
jgi:hypothetical protein